jgi:hypothetical protein
MVYAATSFNRTVTAPSGGLHKTVFGLTPSARFCVTTFLRRTMLLRCFSAVQKRQLQPERYAKYGLDLLEWYKTLF